MNDGTLVAIANNGVIVTLTPLYTRIKSDEPLVNQYNIHVVLESDDPKAYVLECLEGCRAFGPGILKLVEVLGAL